MPGQVAALPPPQATNADAKPQENEWLQPSALTNIALIGVALWASLIALDNLSAIEKQSAETARAASAAIEGNTINRDAFVAEQRPWVSLRVDLAGPLSYDADGWDAGTRWHTTVQYAIKNHGRTPALGAAVVVHLKPWVLTPFTVGETGSVNGIGDSALIERLTTFNTKLDEVLSSFAGSMLFPGEERIGHFACNVAPDDTQAALNNPAYSGQFMMIAVASYSASGIEGRKCTTKIFQLHAHTRSIDVRGETIPATSLGLAISPVYTGKAT